MHLTTTAIFLLPGLALSDVVQKPLQGGALPTTTPGFFQKLKGYLLTAVPTVPYLTAIPHVHNPKPTSLSPPSPPGTAALVEKAVTPLTRSNYVSYLTAAEGARGPTEWMIYITGGNKTCGSGGGRHCHNLHAVFNESALILAVDPLAPHLSVLDCDTQRVLCATLGVKPPVIWHVRRPAPGGRLEGQELGKSEVRVNYLNYTTTSVGDIVALHTGDKYKDGYLYEGWVQPFDSFLARNNLLGPVGWIVFIVGLVPAWTVIMTISMLSRTWIQRRAGTGQEARNRRDARNAAEQRRLGTGTKEE